MGSAGREEQWLLQRDELWQGELPVLQQPQG